MNTISAREFLDRFSNPYGETWEEFFFNSTEDELCAKGMGELIEDIDEHGQQEPVYVDKEGMVDDGCRVAVALAIMGKPVDFVMGEFPGYEPENIFEVDFILESGEAERLVNHSKDLLSFRFGNDWVSCLWGDDDPDDEHTYLIYCPGGTYAADRIVPLINSRLEAAGFDVSGIRVAQADFSEVDGEGSEW